MSYIPHTDAERREMLKRIGVADVDDLLLASVPPEQAFPSIDLPEPVSEMEILAEPSGKPLVRLHGSAKEVADKLGLRHFEVSLSHSQELAIALVVADDDESSFFDNCILQEYKGCQQRCRFVGVGVGQDEYLPAFLFSLEEKNIGIRPRSLQSLRIIAQLYDFSDSGSGHDGHLVMSMLVELHACDCHDSEGDETGY